MFDSAWFSLFVIVVLIFVGWFAVGTQYNVRLGSNALKWLQQGLKIVGEKATLRWLGSSVVELKMAKAKDPFRTAEVLVVMEPRDVPVLWWWGRAQGRRDLIIFRAQLRAAPPFELVARGQKIWSYTDRKLDDTGKWTAVQDGLLNGMRADYHGDISPFAIKSLWVKATQNGITLTRLAVHRSVPNLEVHFLLPKFDQVSPPRVFDSLKQLGEEVLKL